MTPQRWQQVKEIFHVALKRAPEERSGFLEKACGGDESLREEVESLISSHEKDGSFIDSPAYEAATELLTEPQEELKPGQAFGSFEILSLLGEGGMGQVYLALDLRLGRKVALKFLPRSFTNDPDQLRRFEQEARAASSLNHPNILTVHEIGEVKGRRFIAMEYVDGEMLRTRIAGGPFNTGGVLNIAEQLASALAAAHAAGIVHRDIKPENIMLRRDALVKVLDFGLAKLTQPEDAGPDDPTRSPKTSAGVVMGTTAYMSPEQARGQIVDARSDIWSLGVVVYEMVAGHAPFEGKTNSDVLVSILEREPKLLTSLSAKVPEALDWIVTKALTKDRDDRYQTARELLTDIRRLKQRLELTTEVERSIAPELANSRTGDPSTETGPNVSVTSSSQVQSTRRTLLLRLLPLALAIALVGALLIWRSGASWFKRSGPPGLPVIVLMDSPLPDRVYDPETRKEGGTNADDITDILRDLPIVVQKENTSPLWHREEQVLQQNPTLIVMHRSCFAEADAPFDPQSTAIKVSDSKIDAFLGYVGLGNPATKFLIYTRRPDDKGAWASDLEKRFPQLKGRIFTIHVTGGPEHATFRDATTAQALRQQVQAILGLH
jgi:serine/threonine protein kinase